MVVSRTGAVSAASHYRAATDAACGYAGGQAKLYNGAAWVLPAVPVDLNFRVVGVDSAAAPFARLPGTLAHGTPVLASAAGATPEIVKPEVGWLFKRGDTTHLAEQLRSILPHLPEWRKRADYLRRYVEQNFPLERYLEQTIQTYREAAASR